MTLDLEKARKIVGAMSPTPWIVLEDRYGQIDVIRNPNHPMHKEGVIELWGMTSETATPDAIGISYMRSEFPNALDEIERLLDEKAFLEKVIHKKNIRISELERAISLRELEGMLNARSSEIVGRIQECQACQIDQLRAEGKIGPDARPKCDHAWQAAIEERGYQTCLKCGECRNLQYGGRT